MDPSVCVQWGLNHYISTDVAPHDRGQEQAAPLGRTVTDCLFFSLSHTHTHTHTHTQEDTNPIDLLTSILILKHLSFLSSLFLSKSGIFSLTYLFVQLIFFPSSISPHVHSPPCLPVPLPLKLPLSPPLLPIMGNNYGITATMTVQWGLRNRDTRSCTMAKCCHQYGLLWLHRRALGGRVGERRGRENEGRRGGKNKRNW